NGSQDLTEYQIRKLGRGFKIQHKQGKQDELTDIVLTYDVATTSRSLVLHALGLSSSKWSRHGDNSVAIEAYDDGDLILEEERGRGNGRWLRGR
ncbi:MAG: hypothetical protein GY733_24935, partial [bacterium]|nr:hypothetical protein [bacterium]